MMQKLSWHQKVLLKKALQLKCRSFQKQGYLAVNESELWSYLLSYRWKNHPYPSLKEYREDLLSLTPNDFFDYQQLKAQTNPSKLTDWQDIDDLF